MSIRNDQVIRYYFSGNLGFGGNNRVEPDQYGRTFANSADWGNSTLRIQHDGSWSSWHSEYRKIRGWSLMLYDGIGFPSGKPTLLCYFKDQDDHYYFNNDYQPSGVFRTIISTIQAIAKQEDIHLDMVTQKQMDTIVEKLDSMNLLNRMAKEINEKTS
jgi:hypothetical protein